MEKQTLEITVTPPPCAKSREYALYWLERYNEVLKLIREYGLKAHFYEFNRDGDFEFCLKEAEDRIQEAAKISSDFDLVWVNMESSLIFLENNIDIFCQFFPRYLGEKRVDLNVGHFELFKKQIYDALCCLYFHRE